MNDNINNNESFLIKKSFVYEIESLISHLKWKIKKKQKEYLFKLKQIKIGHLKMFICLSWVFVLIFCFFEFNLI